ncbi:MAG: hypothetical protein HONBIEJF_00059 [Fimbriimonadaceae bacterium]|nr:hypothetical protein [Fimbriimonadaceae bacterium]
MIAALLATAIALPLPRVVELPVEGAEIVSVVAVAAVSSDQEDQLAAIQNLCDSVRNGTKDFTRKELVEYGQQAGVPVEASITGDFITVQVAAPTGKLSIALAVIASILCDPMIDAEHWEDFCSTPGTDSDTDWTLGLWPRRHWSKLPSLDFIKWVHGTAFRQERFTLAIGGSYNRAGVLDDVRSAFTNYQAVRTAQRPPRHPGKADRLQPSKVQIHQLEAAIPNPADIQTWIALSALAGGKTSTAYEEVREKQGSAYRLEGFVEWRQSGPTFRLAFATVPDANVPSKEKFLESLRTGISSWTDADIRTAFAGLQAMSKSWMPRTVFRVRPNTGFDGSVTDRTRWLALSTAAKSDLADPLTLAVAPASIDLEVVKKAALQWLEKAAYSVSGPKSG